MGRIQWDDSMSIGIDEIDEQHKKWINFHNHMHDSILGLNGKDSDTEAKEVVKAMMDYTVYHFKCEREYMEKISYPDLVPHIRLHSRFEDEVYQHFRAVIDGEFIIPTQVIKLMKQWICYHITKEDRKIGEFQRNKSKDTNHI